MADLNAYRANLVASYAQELKILDMKKDLSFKKVNFTGKYEVNCKYKLKLARLSILARFGEFRTKISGSQNGGSKKQS